MNKIGIRPDAAFTALDRQGKGYVTISDIRDFMKSQNIYPIEKNLGLLFERLDKNEDRRIDFDEFVQSVTPFLTGVTQQITVVN